MAFAAAEPLRPPRAGRVRRARLELLDGSRTTVHVACHDAARTELRVALLRGQARLEPWCAARGVEEALVGGFFLRPDGMPLGELRTRGVARRHVPFAAPWDAVRACVHVQGGTPAGGPAAAPLSPPPGTRPGGGCRGGAPPPASPRGTSCRPPRAATSCRPGRCSSATAPPSTGASTTRRASAPAPRSSTPTS